MYTPKDLSPILHHVLHEPPPWNPPSSSFSLCCQYFSHDDVLAHHACHISEIHTRINSTCLNFTHVYIITARPFSLSWLNSVLLFTIKGNKFPRSARNKTTGYLIHWISALNARYNSFISIQFICPATALLTQHQLESCTSWEYSKCSTYSGTCECIMHGSHTTTKRKRSSLRSL